MFTLSQYVAGLAVIHIFWLLCYLCGSLVWTPRLAGPPLQQGRGTPGAPLEIVITTATGIAIVGFCSFVLGMVGLLYPLTALVFVVVLFGAFALLGDSPLQRSFWSVRAEALANAATPAVLALYVCLLVLAVPAILPETGFDALTYHLVYATDWANAHRIFVDQWVRYPYYAHNWVLLDSWFLELGLSSHIDFLGWFGGALSALATYGLVDALAERAGAPGRRAAQIAALLSALAVLTAPVFERWNDTGMVDTAIGLFFIVSAASTVMAVATRERRWAIYTVVLFAFFVGTKGSFVAFIPIAVIAAWIASRAASLSIRYSAAACALALILCLPWYARNFIQTGDPVPPYLHLALHEPDSKWTTADMQGVMSDVRVDETPQFLVRMPVNIIRHPDTNEYREPGVSLLMSLIFLPGIVLVYCLRRRGDILTSWWCVFSVLLFYAIIYWILTTHLGRYALLFYPALAAFVGLIAVRLAQGSAARRAVVFLLLACTALPAPVGAAYLNELWQNDYLHLDATYPDAPDYLDVRFAAYREEELVSAALQKQAGSEKRVYVIGDETTAYYFKLHGITQIGDWIGPGRYGDLIASITAGRAAQFLSSFHVSAAIIAPHALITAALVSSLERQLHAAGYAEKRIPGQPAVMFFAPGVPQ